jgi:hypothetical protein
MDDIGKIKLTDLIPEEATITLNGKDYIIRKMNLEDESWLKTRFGQKINTIFVDQDMEAISKLTFRLLKDKSDFLPIQEDGFDDEGNKVKLNVSGPNRILRAISGPANKEELLWAVFKTFGVSRPIPKDTDGEVASPNA